MRFRHIIYPEALERLNSSGISKRVKDASERYDITIMGSLIESEVVDLVNEMKERGIFTHLPDEVKGGFQTQMNGLFKSPEDYLWRTKRFDGTEATEKGDLEDVVGLVGWWSSQVLKPEEVFDYKKFGFNNLTDFTGSVSSLINNTLHRGFKEGYKWEFTTKDGRTFVNEITGDTNCDLRIHRTDITPYKTFDPFGNEVSFRPEMDADRFGAYPYHSVEDSLLAGVIKWIDQTGINAKSLENQARDTIRWAKSLGQRGGTCTEHFFGAPDSLRTRMAYNTGIPLPKLDANDRSEQTSSDGLVASSDYYYGLYIGSDNELAFVSEHRNKAPSPEKKVVLRFMPEEADYLVKGLLYQSAKGLGRTSAAQLISLLEYRFSPEYESDLKEMTKS